MAPDQTWVSEDQYRGIRVGLRIVESWATAGEEPERELSRALRRERDPSDIVIGLATVARLLAIDLAAATGASEEAVLGRLERNVEALQHPLDGARS